MNQRPRPAASKEHFAARALRIQEQHQQPAAEEVLWLREKYPHQDPVARVYLHPMRPWFAIEKLAPVHDPTDKQLSAVSQLTHTMQVVDSMQRHGVTDEELIVAAWVHDLGKLLLLSGEDPANVVCLNYVIDGKPGAGLKNCICTWNHDDYAYQKLKGLVPERTAWLLRQAQPQPQADRALLGRRGPPPHRAVAAALRGPRQAVQVAAPLPDARSRQAPPAAGEASAQGDPAVKIVIPYFEQELSGARAGHQVNRDMLVAWQISYERSGTKMPVCLLTDRSTPKLPEWQHERLIAVDDEPPRWTDPLHKVGWLKHQAYDLCGPCVVMDLDAFPQRSLNELMNLEHIGTPIAMAADPGTPKVYQWSQGWPEIYRKFNAGLILLGSPEICPKFRELWHERYDEWHHITYFDELIFSVLMVNLKVSQMLPARFNTQAGYPGAHPNPTVLHFSGNNRKEALREYVQAQIDLPAHWL